MGSVGAWAKLPSGKASKWAFLAFWIAAVALAFTPAGELTGAQENDAIS